MSLKLYLVKLILLINIHSYCSTDIKSDQSVFNSNPYTSWRRGNNSNTLQAASSDLEVQYVNSTIRRLPQWAKVRNHHILVGYGQSPTQIDEDRTNRSLRSKYDKILEQHASQSEINIQQVPQEQQQESSLPHYNCDSIIRDPAFVIESPQYPTIYPVNRICTYYISKYTNDICQIEVTISDMDIEDTPQCTSDYLDLSGGSGNADQRLCGLMLRNSQRLIAFPSNGSYIRLTFHSDGQNLRPYRGFSAEIRQIANSCVLPRYYPNGTIDYNPTPLPGLPVYPTQTPMAGVYPGYGQRLFPTTRPPYILRPVFSGRKNPNEFRTISQLPVLPTYHTNFSSRSDEISPIYLESYCDIYLSELNGELRSPNYPFGYPINHTCIYTIKRAMPDVCQIEIVFHHFDIQAGGDKKDLSETCFGDYLEMPDHRRLCGYYNQAMSKDHLFKKFYFFRDTSNYLFMQFFSDYQPTPDGSGFWIEIKQLRNSCPSTFDTQKPMCDRVITGQYSSVDRVYSPNFPQYYQPQQQCVYFIQPADDTTCEFELDLVQFDLEANKDFNAEYGCIKDYVQLPDRSRICGRMLFRRMFTFPKYHKRTSMFYFQTDQEIENRGFEIVLRQFPNTCNNTSNSHLNPNSFNGPFDPNLRPPIPGLNLNPTPVFSYSNTSGFQPYLSPSNNLPGTKYYSTSYGSKKGGNLSPFLFQQLPDLLNNPRNVDSTGTIPLYFANGTLAARIPPLKPVDLIPFLKKGKSFSQKTGSGINSGNDPRNLYATVRSTNNLNNILTNRFPTPDSNSNDAEVFDSSAKLREFSPRTGFGPRTETNYMPTIQLQPTYNCDQVVSRNIEYIRSPNFPSNYPTVSRCIYSIIKSDISVCQVRLSILSLDLEYTNGCRNDYFQIETTGEKLCGRLSGPETRLINYYGFSRDIRLIFNSDRQTTGAGFEVRVEQVPNSCDEGNNRTLAGEMNTVGGRGRIQPAIEGRGLVDVRNSRLMQPSQSPSAQALVLSNLMNNSNTLGGNPRICRTTAAADTIFESDNFPMPYPGGTDCLYKIFKANRNVCRLEIELLNFSVGSSQVDFLKTDPNRVVQQQTAEMSTANCLNDFLEIDSIRYCGNREGEKIAINFPRMLQEISLRFVTFSPDSSSGFRIKINQIDQNCRSAASLLIGSSSNTEMNDFTPAIIESCAKISENSKESANINEEIVRVQSPKFGLGTSFGYESFLDCDYLVAKASRDVCALEVRFEQFSLEDSRSCTKDYLEINSNGMRLCGQLARDATRTFDFPNDVMRLHFHTDGDRNETGFAIILRQIRC